MADCIEIKILVPPETGMYPYGYFEAKILGRISIGGHDTSSYQDVLADVYVNLGPNYEENNCYSGRIPVAFNANCGAKIEFVAHRSSEEDGHPDATIVLIDPSSNSTRFSVIGLRTADTPRVHP